MPRYSNLSSRQPGAALELSCALSIDMNRMPVHSRCRLVPALLLGVLASLGTGCGRGRPTERPVVELPGQVYFTEPGQFATQRAPDGRGWVRLPRIANSSAFRATSDPERAGYVQAAICGECHLSQYESCQFTAHFRSSAQVEPEMVRKQLDGIKSTLPTRDSTLSFEISAETGQIQQAAVIQHAGQRFVHRRPMDLVIGSGNHGQTFLYWEGNSYLYQLPVSFFSEGRRWVNSPGIYRDGTADFAREIKARCLECHVTYFVQAEDAPNRYDRDKFILGVTCVRCHGSGWAHVQFHRQHPDEMTAEYIVNPGSLSRERLNEVCAQCHSGVGRAVQPALSYQPGEPLEEALQLDLDADNPENDDPHAANQLARLMKSQCFQKSNGLSCITCHNPHIQERGELETFSARCLSCHQRDGCGLASEWGGQLTGRCVQCHMPSRRDQVGALQTETGALQPLLRDHFIGHWPDATQQILHELKAEAEPE